MQHTIEVVIFGETKKNWKSFIHRNPASSTTRKL